MTTTEDGRATGVPTVVVLADDLIWATRLVGQLRTLGVAPVRLGSAAALEAVLGAPAADPAGTGRPTHAVIDLTARAYDGLAAVRRTSAAGLHVLCVAQHDDHDLRRAARAAGADRVYAYRTLFEDGHATLAAWLGVSAPAPGSLAVPPLAGTPAR